MWAPKNKPSCSPSPLIQLCYLPVFYVSNPLHFSTALQSQMETSQPLQAQVSRCHYLCGKGEKHQTMEKV
uniref:Uncharacterized protein n=2 Tax=Anguilla anguilla TaxID=7936 RepID=A0A0E9QNW2_ANGAN